MEITNLFLTLGGIFLVVLLLIGLDIYRARFCRYCNAKMEKYYDPEEDAEVYQCPKCGRCYIIQ